MKSATITEIKKVLDNLTHQELRDLCIRLARHKTENKELLGFLLFDSGDLVQWMKEVKKEIDLLFGEINKNNFYYARKSIRKILRFTLKNIKYSGSKQAEAELLIHFCLTLRKSGININKSQAMLNLYHRQTQKIKTALDALHEDLRYDYQADYELVMK